MLTSRPFHIWLAFAICLTVGVGGMVWLTLKACELDRAEAIARRQAEMEEAIGRALWRMDTRLAPILAEEAVRPAIVYQAVLPDDTPPSKTTSATAAAPRFSPLLLRPSDFVRLNFQLSASNVLTSPQCVAADQVAWAAQAGLSETQRLEREKSLRQLQQELLFDQLLDKLPEETLPDQNEPQFVAAANPQLPTAQNLSLPSKANDEQRFVANRSVELAQAQQDAEQLDAAQQRGAKLPPTPPQAANAINSLKGRTANPASQNYDIQSRSQSLQQYARLERFEQSRQGATVDNSQKNVWATVREGVSRPMWIGSQLVLARRVTLGQQRLIQGCWLDWPKLKQVLLDEVADLLPQADLEPLVENQEFELGRLLATLPVQLVVPRVSALPETWSPIRVSLALAWGALLIAAGAVALLLQGVLTLSERRGAFVSAVTHELRTPLTTFRMYAEMLAGGMVPAGDRQQQYLETLRVEADRLSHLVENVLQYARLERGRPGHRRECVTIATLLDRMQSRLAERAQQADMQLVVEIESADRDVAMQTDPAAVEQILFNLVDNACKYAATAADRRIHFSLRPQDATVVLAISDHGPGISSQGAKKLFRPFSKSVHEAANSAPGVGLGLALSQRLARELGGTLRFAESTNTGARFELTLPRAV